MIKKIVFIILFYLLFPTVMAQCIPLFPYKDRFLGADGAYSIDLGNHQRVWFFGDTFVGKDDNSNRKNVVMISNSIGISMCRNQTFSIQYFWQGQNTDVPKDFFVSHDRSIVYWPRGGFYYHGEIYIFLSKIYKNPKKGIWGFENKGTTLAILSAIHLAPRAWKIRYIDLPLRTSIWAAASVVVDENYVYFYSVIENSVIKNHPVILLRLSLAQLESKDMQIEMLTKTGDWQKKINLEKAMIVMPSASTEMSVHFDARKQEWLAIYSSSFLSQTPGIVYRSARNFKGPWSEEKIIYRYEEPRKNRDVFCYAAKAHPEKGDDGYYKHSKKNPLMLTYVCNHFSFDQLINDLTVYKPIGIRFRKNV